MARVAGPTLLAECGTISAMPPWISLALLVAVWVFVITGLVRGRAGRWVKAAAIAVLVALSVWFIMPAVVRAKQEAAAVRAEKVAQEKELNAMLRDSRARR